MILIKAGTFMACAMMMGRWILPALFTQIAHSRSQELFILTALTVAVASALITQRVGLSMSLGAFIAGMLLGESHYRHQIEADIRPFRDVLLGLFFISVGMLMDLNILQQYWFRILFFTLCMLLIKTLVVTVAVMVFKESKHNAIETGILLAQGGEFGFVLLALGAYYDLIPLDVVSFTLAIIIFSMMISSIMIRHCSTLTAWVARTIPGFKEALVIPLNTIKTITSTPHDHVMILGYGRIGQTIGRFLTRENIPFIAIDDDTRRVHDAITAGEPVIYGNATQYTLLEQAGLANAKLLIISFDDLEAALAITRQIRIHNTTLNVLVRTRDTSNLDELMRAGVSEVIPEILEASLMLVSQVLLNCKVSSKRVETLLSETRRAHYQQLHAFYQGDEVQSNTDYLKPKPCLHPIVIPENSYWIGQPLENIQKSLPHISVAGIKRLAQQHPMTPSETIQLEAHDTRILQGLSEHIERAEIELTAHTPPYSTT
ncbi:MAG: cation:proton antiporter, partial [Gammaproteobacteria bacterium]